MKTKYWILGGLTLLIAPLFFGLYATFSSVTTAPARVITKTLQTDNIISNYEWYYDTQAAFKVRKNQVSQFHGLFKTEPNSDEKNRLRIEMAAMQQSCRELAEKYNVNSVKLNKRYFKGWDLPESLDASKCELTK